MSRLAWTSIEDRIFETGVDRGVLYIGATAVPWVGLVSVAESTSGGERTQYYYDGIMYLNLASDTEFSATLEAFTYPDEFGVCDGTVESANGLFVTNQERASFGLSYRTLIGNPLEGTDHGYKIHLVYNAFAAPTEVTYSTVSDSPEATTFSWELTTLPTVVSGLRPTAHFVIDSRKTTPLHLEYVENILYGLSGTYPSTPRLPTVEELLSIFGAAVPEYDAWDAGSPIDMTIRIEDNGNPFQSPTKYRDEGYLDTQSGALVSDGAYIPTIEQRTLSADAPNTAADQTFDGGAL